MTLNVRVKPLSFAAWIALIAIASACSEAEFSGASDKKGENLKPAGTSEGDSTETATAPSSPETSTIDSKGSDSPEDSSSGTTESSSSSTTEISNSSTTVTSTSSTGEVSIESSGFVCSDNLEIGVGGWTGSWSGTGLLGQLSGKIDLSMKLNGKELAVSDYRIVGGYGNEQQLDSVVFGFTLACGDHTFKPASVNWLGSPYGDIVMSFTHQNWESPTPSLKGTWVAGSAGASGTWEIARRQ